MLKVGLTGGIGCGKSTITALFKELDIPVIDADEISHDLVKPGKPTLHLIKNIFGDNVINANDGSLNRKHLREIVFSDMYAKQQLENILHPLIYQTIKVKLADLIGPYAIVSIPLLLETGMTDLVDRILVIDCSIESQIERVKKRDNIDISIIQSIIDSQVPRSARVLKADDLIDNSGPIDKLAEQVKKLHNLYILISHYQD